MYSIIGLNITAAQGVPRRFNNHTDSSLSLLLGNHASDLCAELHSDSEYISFPPTLLQMLYVRLSMQETGDYDPVAALHTPTTAGDDTTCRRLQSELQLYKDQVDSRDCRIRELREALTVASASKGMCRDLSCLAEVDSLLRNLAIHDYLQRIGKGKQFESKKRSTARHRLHELVRDVEFNVQLDQAQKG